MEFEEEDFPKTETVRRPLAYKFDSVEVFAGAATVTSAVAALGYSVCCPIDISYGEELDVTKLYVIEWLIHLVVTHQVLAVLLEPPCTTFSVMRRPALRSKNFPFGFDLLDEQTDIGTKLAHRALQLLKVCARVGLTGILENPWSSKIKYLPGWSHVVGLDCCRLVRCDSCAFGSIHLKSFAFLCVWADVSQIARRCSGDHDHVPVQGIYTKKSATYVPKLAEALAEVVAQGIRRIRAFSEDLEQGRVGGLENQLINELCVSQQWTLDSVWTFKVQTHINILELSVVVRLVSRLVAQGKSLRVVVLVDSNVVRCAASKGRSSSKALSKALNRLAALSVLGGIYLVLGFAPTRLNPSDDPTRDVVLRDPSPGFDLSAWGRRDLYALASLSKLRRPFSNWVRLCLCLLGSSLCHCADRSVFRVPAFPFGLSQSGDIVPPYQFQSVLDFDQTLGFPGEGPFSFLVGIGIRPPKCWWFLTVAHLCLCHGVLVPRNAGDLGRQQLRSGRPPLQSGRPVLGLTNQHRETFINQFEVWLQGQGFSLEAMLENHFYEIDHLNRLLV